MKNKENIITNLLDVIDGKYVYAKNSRNKEYAVYEDFKNRFLFDLNQDEKLNIWTSSFSRLTEEQIKVWHWLATSYSIPIYTVYIELLEETKNCTSNKKYEVLKSIIYLVLSSWPDYDFNYFSDEQKKYLVNEFVDIGEIENLKS